MQVVLCTTCTRMYACVSKVYYSQVLSESVHKALVLTGGEEAHGTAEFVLMFDRFFDCLNVSSYNTGKTKRKAFQDPYQSPTDFRLRVSDNICVCTCAVTIFTYSG